MGILIVHEPASCTHLASPRLLRTQKFICALARAPVIISTDFVDDCLSENKLLDPDNYLLDDKDGEQRLGYKLSESIDRAKENKGRMLRGYSIYCTEAVHGGFDTFKSIIEANGGKCLLYRARAGPNTALRAGLEGDTDGSDSGTPAYLYLISGTTPEEAKLWPKFQQMAEGMGKTPVLARTDWMLNSALSQRVHWTDGYALTEQDIGVDA